MSWDVFGHFRPYCQRGKNGQKKGQNALCNGHFTIQKHAVKMAIFQLLTRKNLFWHPIYRIAVIYLSTFLKKTVFLGPFLAFFSPFCQKCLRRGHFWGHFRVPFGGFGLEWSFWGSFQALKCLLGALKGSKVAPNERVLALRRVKKGVWSLLGPEKGWKKGHFRGHFT